MRFATVRVVVRLFAAAAVLAAAPAVAQEPATITLLELARAGGDEIAAQAALPQPPRPAATEAQERPRVLVPLYVSLAALNAMDVHSTRRALSKGAVETNPLMKGVAGNTGALAAVKAAGTVGMIYGSEKLWKKNRAAAIAFMVAANSAMAWVVQHNYRAVK